MKHLTVLTRTADRADAVGRLRDLGVLHLADAAPDMICTKTSSGVFF
jgi:hypothetical protein